MEVHGGFVGRGEEGAGQLGATEPPDDVTGVVGPVADFNKVVVRLRGEVQELDVSTCSTRVNSLPLKPQPSLRAAAPLTH